MKTTVQTTNKDLVKALSYLSSIFVLFLLIAGSSLIEKLMKLIF